MQGIAWACAALWIGIGSLDVVLAASEGAYEPAPKPLAAAAPADSSAAGPPTSAAKRGAPAAVGVGWQTLARSSEDRVIEYARFGSGDLQTLVVAPLAGDEIEGIELIERLANHLAQFPRSLVNATVTIVRDPNPDGRFRRTAGNSRGVLVDQNFPTRYWRRVAAGERWLSGREPESEAETRALLDLLHDLKPDRLIILGSTRRMPTLQYAGPAEAMAGRFANLGNVRPLPLNAAEFPGSLAAYAGCDQEIPALEFRLASRSSVEKNWLTYKRALLSALDGSGEKANESRQTASAADELPGAERQAAPSGLLATPIALQTRTPDEQSASPSDAAFAPRALSAEELEHGAPLVPVGRPPVSEAPEKASEPKSFTPPGMSFPSQLKTSQSNSPPRQHPYTPGAAIPKLNYSLRPQPNAGIGQGARPGGSLSAPRALYAPSAASGAGSTSTPPAAPAAPSSAASQALPRLERLPPVDADSPPMRSLRQEPIPFYPGTGY